MRKFPQLFCLPRRHVEHNNFGTGGVDQQYPGVLWAPAQQDGSDNARRERTLAAVAWTPWLVVGNGRDTVRPRLLHGHLPLYPFNSFFSVLRKRQSVP